VRVELEAYAARNDGRAPLEKAEKAVEARWRERALVEKSSRRRRDPEGREKLHLLDRDSRDRAQTPPAL
jgi:hypothetical protein